jgi:putative membrane protein
MFIDYLTLMLLNMAAGLVILALFLGSWIDKDPKKAAPGFLLVGTVALVTGFAVVLTWPLPGPANIIFGEMTVLLGGVFFTAGLSLVCGWSLTTVGIYAAFAGTAAIVLAARILSLNYTQEPIVAALGYAGAGVTAILSWPGMTVPKLKWLRWIAVIVALLTALCWAVVAFPSYWAHPEIFAKWPGAIGAAAAAAGAK